MKSFDTELAKYAKKTRLKAAERADIRERILSYIEYHPLPKDMRTLTSKVSPHAFFHTISRTTVMRIAAGTFAFFLVIVSVPFAAERAVPGDVLYPIKTRVNEEIRAQFISSPYERVAFETELMERRIAEARLLAKKGKLSEEVEAAIAETVKNHAEAAQQGIEELKIADAEEGAIAEIAFGSALEVQEAVFESEATVDDEAIDSIADALRAAKETADAQKSTTTPSYEPLVARVELETTRAYELFQSIELSATDEERGSIERRLTDIESSIASAQRAYEDNVETEAVALLSETLSSIQKLISFMTDIDVRENVALDMLVPVVLTPEERIAEVRVALADIESRWTLEAPEPEVEETIATSTDAAVDGSETETETEAESEETGTVETEQQTTIPEIIERALIEIPELLTAAEAALAAGDVAVAEDVITEAETLVADVYAYEGGLNVEVKTEEPEEEIETNEEGETVEETESDATEEVVEE